MDKGRGIDWAAGKELKSSYHTQEPDFLLCTPGTVTESKFLTAALVYSRALGRRGTIIGIV